MATDTEYRPADQVPGRAEIDAMAGPLLLEFGTASCGFCRALAPKVTKLVESHPEVQHLRIEDGPGQPLGRSFQVRLWPTLVFLRDGKVLRQLARPGYEQLDEAFRTLVTP